MESKPNSKLSRSNPSKDDYPLQNSSDSDSSLEEEGLYACRKLFCAMMRAVKNSEKEECADSKKPKKKGTKADFIRVDRLWSTDQYSYVLQK